MSQGLNFTTINTLRAEAEIDTRRFGKVSITVTGRQPIQENGDQIVIRDAKFIRVEAFGRYWPPRQYTGTVIVTLKKNCSRNPMEVLVNNKLVEVPFLS